METILNGSATETIPQAPQPPEDPQARYVAICAKVQVKGKELREEAFKAIESGDTEKAVALGEEIKKMDFLYMLSLQTGMKIHESNKLMEAKKAEAEQAKRLAEEELAAQNKAAAEEAAPKGFFSKLFRG